MSSIVTLFAAEYNCDAYGAGTYNESGVCTTTSGNPLLAPQTGYVPFAPDVAIAPIYPLVLGIALLVGSVGLVVRSIKLRSAREHR